MPKFIYWIIAIIIALAVLYFFKPGSESEKPLGVLLMAGDVSGCDPEEIERATKTGQVLDREINSLKQASIPVRIVILGDLAYESGTHAEFKCYDKAWGEMLRRTLAEPQTDVMPVPGNHEYETEKAAGFFEAFKTNTWISAAPDAYFQAAFPQGSLGAWRLFGLNSEIDNAAASPQYKWLAQHVGASRENCVLAFWHRPVFSSGKHGHEGSKTDAPVKQQAMSEIEELLARNGVSLITNGHDHNFEELAPHDANGKFDAQGIRSFVVGTGGRKLRKLKGQRWTGISRVFDAETYGILRVELFANRYSWAFLPSGDASRAKYAGTAPCRKRNIN